MKWCCDYCRYTAILERAARTEKKVKVVKHDTYFSVHALRSGEKVEDTNDEGNFRNDANLTFCDCLTEEHKKSRSVFL